MGLIKIFQFSVLSVHCQGILGQIIGPDTEKIHQFCQFIADHHSCRSLYHNPLLRKPAGNLVIFQFFLYFLHKFLYLSYFFH